MVQCYLGLGSNVSDRVGMITRAVACLGRGGDIVVRRLSGMYETRPWGNENQPDFVNAVAEVDTGLSPKELLTRVKGIERELGRRKGARWGPRRIDIDILLYGSEVVSEEDITIPHPHICERAFVLAPLAEIAPDLVHPLTGRCVKRYLEEIEESGETSWRNLDT
ncbi:MAG: 2-amino-4-hydroxy-6-hydroxymethyldihydropteridine diphosphokinase [Candidatus Eisenbacteria bacterium]